MVERNSSGPATVRALRGDEMPLRVPPHNYEAEQALLGAILANNLVLDRVSEFLLPEHFADAVHGRIYEAATKLIQRGQIANVLTLKNMFDQDAALAEVGGAQYLAPRTTGGRSTTPICAGSSSTSARRSSTTLMPTTWT